MSQKEIWKQFRGSYYYASNLGRIKGPKGVLTHYRNGLGRQLIDMRKTQGKVFLVHRVVAETFFGPCPKGLQVNHKNGNKDDHRIENLEYITAKENIIHSVENNLRHKSKIKSYCDKTERILSLLSKGMKQKEVASIVGCDPSHVSRTSRGEAGHTFRRMNNV